MSVLTKLSRVFARDGRTRAPYAVERPAGHLAEDPVPGAGPVAIDIHDPTDLTPAPKSKQELLAELQKNYAEAVDLIRKVDRHLDEQAVRSQRLLEFAERMPESLATLPAIRDQGERLNETVEALAASSARGAAAGETQAEAIVRVRELAERSAETGEQVATTLTDFRSTVQGMATATGELGQTLHDMHRRDGRRDEHLAELISANTRWMVTLAAICSIGLVLAIVLAIVAIA